MASANPQFFTKSEISSMRVQPLRDALAERGLGTSGNGTALKERLRDAIHSKIRLAHKTQNASQSNVASVANDLDISSGINFKKSGPVYKRIPKASRMQASKSFAAVITNVTRNNDKDSFIGICKDSWEKLLSFASVGIGNSTRGGKKNKSQATVVNERLTSFMNNVSQNPQDYAPKINKKNVPSLKNRVSVKMAQGDIKGAVNILTSKDSILQPSDSALSRLQEKHPPKHSSAVPATTPSDVGIVNFKVDKAKLKKAIHSFKKGIAGGPDGLRPQHLIDMTGEILGETAEKLLDALVDFLNLIIFPGNIPKEVQPIFFSANLVALSKVDGGVRPIAMGGTLRRLAAKCISASLGDFCKQEFRPSQLGVGTPKGCEAAVHSLRSYLENQATENKVLLKIDFRNAFNSIRRDMILPIVQRKIPSIYNYVYQNYANESDLFFGDSLIKSQEGVQQGDPIGPFLFSLGIMDIIKSMNSELNIWYLDDGTLAGDVTTVLNDFKEIIKATESHGLEVNPSKCELFLIRPQSPECLNALTSFSKIASGIKMVNESNLTLLGAPIFSAAINSVLEPKLDNLKLMVSRLKEIDNHEALFLLQNCFSMPKLTYFLRTAPCFSEEDLLRKYDNTIKNCLIDILNIPLLDHAWNQATLPVAKGGLGLRPALEVALSGFLSSVAASDPLVNTILPSRLPKQRNCHFDLAVHNWKGLSGLHTLPKDQIYQSEWDKGLYEFRYENLLKSIKEDSEIARILSVSSPSASDWLYAIPIPSLGLHLDPMTLKIACGLRLGSTLCHPYQCICGNQVEPNARHGLACKKQLGKWSRHNEVNNLIKRGLVQAKITATLEPTNLSTLNGKRPDGITYTTWKQGKPLIWDFTCCDTLCDSYVKSSSRCASSAAALREDQKINHYKDLTNYFFVPVAVETYGAWGPRGIKLIKEIGKKMCEITGEKRSTFFLSQSISVAIQRGNAACIIGTAPTSEGLDEIFDFVDHKSIESSDQED